MANSNGKKLYSISVYKTQITEFGCEKPAIRICINQIIKFREGSAYKPVKYAYFIPSLDQLGDMSMMVDTLRDMCATDCIWGLTEKQVKSLFLKAITYCLGKQTPGSTVQVRPSIIREDI